MRNHLFLGAAAVALIAPMGAMAQETTTVVRGTVTSGGTAVAGARVTVTNVPSGTTAEAVTGTDGSFNLSGLRVGGPFTVAVAADGYQGATVTDIYTVIAQPYDVPIELALAGADAGGDIVVTASSIAGAGTQSMGPATVLTAADIANVATINRDVRDLMRRDPFARLDDTPSGGRAVSFAGQNARFNRFSVDGVPVTDNFGLNPDGLPTRRSPIPLDAIGQFQTKVAPYDVREGNFQGGAINAILKSGTNSFHGTGFYSYSSDELTGKKTKAGPGVPTGRVTLPNFKIENYGAQLAGPIIKDKLFFMVAGERIRAGTPIPEGTAETNAGTVIPSTAIAGGNLTDAVVNQITSIAQSRYGYDAGGVLSNSQDKDDRLAARIDANLSDTQRASLTYLYTKDSIRFNQNASTTAPSLGLESNGYVASNRLHTGVFQLNSDWSDEFSTEVRAFYKDYKRGQDPILGRGFAQFQVCAAPTSDRANPGSQGAAASTACAPGYASVYLGPDISRQSNALTSRTYGGLVQARLSRDDHDLRIFADFQDTKIFNQFLQRSAGDYYFDSIADFAAGNAQRLRYQNAVPSLVPDDAAARFRYQSYAFGIQDNWRVTDWFTLDYGIRYDMYGGNSRPAANTSFTNRLGFTNQAYISGRGVVQPRIGFELKPIDDLSVRGGVGIFSGGSPDVYVSNSFSNTGFLSNSVDIRQNNDGGYTVPSQTGGAAATIGQAALTNVNGTAIPGAVNTYLQSLTGSTTSPALVNALDPNFKLPSQWRSTLSFDYAPDALGGINFGADLFYSAVRNQVFFTDARVRANGLLTPDGRTRYSSITNFADTNYDLLLTNTKKGRSYVAVARVDKTFDFGLSAGASFTYQDIKDQAPATSSTANSNYGNGAFLDANGAAYGISNDQVKYNIKYNLTFDHAFFGDYKTTFALFGETRIGRPYSYTMQDTSNARSPVFGTVLSSTRYLLYVPTGIDDPRVSYGSTVNSAGVVTQSAESVRDTFNALIESSGLSKYRGKIAPRNAFNSKWFTRIDLHVAQQIPTGLFGSRFEIFGDIENVTNLLNKNWGQIREYTFPYTIPAVRVQCLATPVATGTTATPITNSSQACAQYRYLAPNTAPTDTIYARQSLYAIRVGARFTF